MKLLESMRIWWQRQTGEEETPFDGDTPAWAISLVAHLVLLMILTAIWISPPPDDAILVVVADETEEEELIVPEEFHYALEKTTEIGANSVAGETAAMAQAAIESDLSEVPAPEIDAEIGNVVMPSPVVAAVAPNLTKNVAVRGTATGVGATGAVGAIDRITHEILLSLEQRKTLVVWVFDQSGSLQRQREAILERFDRVYHELGVIEQAGNEAFAKYESKPLLTSVVAFGQDYQLLTPKPTDDLEAIKTAVSSINNDSTGVERVFAAIHETAKRHIYYRMEEPRRNVMIVAFTDEAGDDQNLLDPTVDICRKYQMPVYVVGVPAPFGRREVEIKYVDPDPQYDQTPQWIRVHQGPESLLPERVKLRFSGSKQRDEPIDSGFGPFALTRLCYETGGIYFAVHPNRNYKGRKVNRRETASLAAHLAYFFDPTIMRRYQPEYVAAEEYQKFVMANKARLALVQAAKLSWASSLSAPQTRFPKVSEADLANLLTEAQKDAAKLEPKIEAIYQALQLGEKDRAKVRRPRWQAGYDLAMGRTLAVMVRTKAYNAMLAKAKNGMKFENPKNDTWLVVPANEISVGSVLEKQAKQARMYLERCVKEHEGTPWAMLAKRELDEPIGWKWEEDYTGVNEPRQGVGNGNANPNRPDDKRRMIKKPKPKRRPKL